MQGQATLLTLPRVSCYGSVCIKWACISTLNQLTSESVELVRAWRRVARRRELIILNSSTCLQIHNKYIPTEVLDLYI